LIGFVGPDDALDQLVAYDVFLAEVDELDARDILQDGTNLDEAGNPTGGQVHLGDVR
jgi:hypothetical protein